MPLRCAGARFCMVCLLACEGGERTAPFGSHTTRGRARALWRTAALACEGVPPGNAAALTAGQGPRLRRRHLECVSGCTAPLRGTLRPGLHRLPSLATLHLHENALTGTLPVEWGDPGSFPALADL